MLALLLVGAGCGRCGGGSAADGGADAALASPAVAHGRLPATDLRSAVILIYPEYRWTYQVGGRASLNRTVQWSGEGHLKDALAPLLTSKGFADVQETDGTVQAKRAPFTFDAKRDGSTLHLSLSMPITNSEINRLLYSPAALTTEHMQVMMPAVPNARVVDDTFVLDLGYEARPERANFLIRQVVEGLMAVGWTPTAPLDGWEKERKPDGGVGDIPLVMTATIRQQDTGGSLQVTRDSGKVRLHYVQPLITPGR